MSHKWIKLDFGPDLGCFYGRSFFVGARWEVEIDGIELSAICTETAPLASAPY
jgi:hypothetical protein